jgi:hypothetical protein
MKGIMTKKIISAGLALYLLTLGGCVIIPDRPAYYVQTPAVVHINYWHHY